MSSGPFHPDKVDAGRRLAQLREALGMTQDQMAAALEIEAKRLGEWERGRNTPDILILGKKAQVLGYTVDWVARGALVGMDAALRDRLLLVLQAWGQRDKPQRGRPRKTRTPTMAEPLAPPPRPPPRPGLHEDPPPPLKRT